MKVAVVPAKEFTAAKQRLADALPAATRAALARAMLEDVLAALAAAPLDRIVVVTPDAEVASVAERWGATIVRETEGQGHTAAVARGVRARARVGGHRPPDRARRPPLPHGRRGAPHPGRLRTGAGGRLRPVPERARHQRGVSGAARRRPPPLRRALVRRPPGGRARARDRAGRAPPPGRRARHRPTRGRRRPSPRPAAGSRAAAALGDAGLAPLLRAPRDSRSSASADIPEVRPGDDLASLALAAAAAPGHAARGRRRRGAEPEGRLQGRGPARAARRRHALAPRDRGRAIAEEGSPADRGDPPRVAPHRPDGPRHPDHGDAPRPDLRERGRRPVERGAGLAPPPPRGSGRVGPGLREPRAGGARASTSR